MPFKTPTRFTPIVVRLTALGFSPNGCTGIMPVVVDEDAHRTDITSADSRNARNDFRDATVDVETDRATVRPHAPLSRTPTAVDVASTTCAPFFANACRSC